MQCWSAHSQELARWKPRIYNQLQIQKADLKEYKDRCMDEWVKLDAKTVSEKCRHEHQQERECKESEREEQLQREVSQRKQQLQRERRAKKRDVRQNKRQQQKKSQERKI
jgi:hypothetical protein